MIGFLKFPIVKDKDARYGYSRIRTVRRHPKALQRRLGVFADNKNCAPPLDPAPDGPDYRDGRRRNYRGRHARRLIQKPHDHYAKLWHMQSYGFLGEK